MTGGTTGDKQRQGELDFVQGSSWVTGSMITLLSRTRLA